MLFDKAASAESIKNRFLIQSTRIHFCSVVYVAKPERCLQLKKIQKNKQILLRENWLVGGSCLKGLSDKTRAPLSGMEKRGNWDLTILMLARKKEITAQKTL